jgi:hypothetical protein
MSKTANSLAALGVAALALVLAAWLDGTVINDARKQAAAEFNTASIAWLFTLGSIAVAGGCLLVAWMGFRASALVGLVYAVVGGLFALLPWLVMSLGATINDVPAVLPEAIATPLSQLWLRTLGPLNAVGTIGGAMLIAGLISMVRSLRRRDVAVPAAPIATDPAKA